MISPTRRAFLQGHVASAAAATLPLQTRIDYPAEILRNGVIMRNPEGLTGVEKHLIDILLRDELCKNADRVLPPNCVVRLSERQTFDDGFAIGMHWTYDPDDSGQLDVNDINWHITGRQTTVTPEDTTHEQRTIG